MITLQNIKKQAVILKEYLKQSNSAISHNSCLHAVAKMYGYKNWNTMSAYLENQENIQSTQRLDITPSLSLEPEVLEGAFHELLQQSYGVEINPENFSINRDPQGNSIGISLKIEGGCSIEIDGNVKYHSSDKKVRAYLLGTHIGHTIANILSINNSSSLKGKKPRPSKDIVRTVKFAEQRNRDQNLPQAIPILTFQQHVETKDLHYFVKVQEFLKQQQPTADPRAFFITIKEIFGNNYYVGCGGTHIHIKSLDEQKVIAFITAGIGCN